MEAGSAWPSWVHDNDGGDVVVVAQPRDASAAELTESVVHRLATLEQSGRQAITAVVAVADRQSEDTTAARWAIGCALLNHLRRTTQGSLVLSHSEQATTDTRASLLELAGSIVRAVGDRGTSATVRFSSEGEPR
jgi:hypothetical protein